MAPFELEQPLNASGGGLGLFYTAAYNASFSQMVAVEFNTFNNPWDPDNNHVGVDVNSIVSKVDILLRNETANCSLCDENLKNGKQWDESMDYDGEAKMLQVFLFCNLNGISISKPPTSILVYDIDLRDFLSENIKVGLSASTGFSP